MTRTLTISLRRSSWIITFGSSHFMLGLPWYLLLIVCCYYYYFCCCRIWLFFFVFHWTRLTCQTEQWTHLLFCFVDFYRFFPRTQWERERERGREKRKTPTSNSRMKNTRTLLSMAWDVDIAYDLNATTSNRTPAFTHDRTFFVYCSKFGNSAEQKKYEAFMKHIRRVLVVSSKQASKQKKKRGKIQNASRIMGN